MEQAMLVTESRPLQTSVRSAGSIIYLIKEISHIKPVCSVLNRQRVQLWLSVCLCYGVQTVQSSVNTTGLAALGNTVQIKSKGKVCVTGLILK